MNQVKEKSSKHSRKHVPVVQQVSAILAQIADHEVILKTVLEKLPMKDILAYKTVSRKFSSIIRERVFRPAFLKPKGLILTYKQHNKVYLPLSSVPWLLILSCPLHISSLSLFGVTGII